MTDQELLRSRRDMLKCMAYGGTMTRVTHPAALTLTDSTLV